MILKQKQTLYSYANLDFAWNTESILFVKGYQCYLFRLNQRNRSV